MPHGRSSFYPISRHRRILRRASLLALLVASAATVACSGSGDTGTDTDTDRDTDADTDADTGPPLPNGVAAVFVLVTDEGEEIVDWRAATDNLVFCRTYGNEAWIRMAELVGADGENGPHVDIDVCQFSTSGTWAAKDRDAACGADATFDISWHGEQGAVWASNASSAACELTLSGSETEVVGSFTCDGLEVVANAEGTVNLRFGQFRCAVEEG